MSSPKSDSLTQQCASDILTIASQTSPVYDSSNSTASKLEQGTNYFSAQSLVVEPEFDHSTVYQNKTPPSGHFVSPKTTADETSLPVDKCPSPVEDVRYIYEHQRFNKAEEFTTYDGSEISSETKMNPTDQDVNRHSTENQATCSSLNLPSDEEDDNTASMKSDEDFTDHGIKRLEQSIEEGEPSETDIEKIHTVPTQHELHKTHEDSKKVRTIESTCSPSPYNETDEFLSDTKRSLARDGLESCVNGRHTKLDVVTIKSSNSPDYLPCSTPRALAAPECDEKIVDFEENVKSVQQKYSSNGGRSFCDVEKPARISPDNYLHLAEVLYKCRLCKSIPMVFTSPESFRDHIEDEHTTKTNSDSYYCDRCDLRFSTEEDVSSHACSLSTNTAIHDNIQFKSHKSLCNLDKKQSLVRHERRADNLSSHGSRSPNCNEKLCDSSRRQCGNYHHGFTYHREAGEWGLGVTEKRTRNPSPDNYQNVKRIKEVTDEILFSHLKGAQGNNAKNAKSPALIPGCTPEFGRYTKLVREGGNVVYFCQVCNLKSQLKFAFHVHCNTEHHHNKVRLADQNRFDLLEKQPMKCFKSATDTSTSKTAGCNRDSIGNDKEGTGNDDSDSSSSSSESSERERVCRETRCSEKSEDDMSNKLEKDTPCDTLGVENKIPRHSRETINADEVEHESYCHSDSTDRNENSSWTGELSTCGLQNRKRDAFTCGNVTATDTCFVSANQMQFKNDRFSADDSEAHSENYRKLFYGCYKNDYDGQDENAGSFEKKTGRLYEKGDKGTKYTQSDPLPRSSYRNSVTNDTRISLRNKIQNNLKDGSSCEDKMLTSERTDRLYRCSLCQFSCDNIMNYKKHYDTEHVDERTGNMYNKDLADLPKTQCQGVESMKVQQLKKVLPDIVRANSRCSVSRDVLLQKVSHIWDLPEVITWGSACNKAFREVFPECLSQRKGKFKKTYFFGVEFVNDIFDSVEHMEEKEANSDSECSLSYQPMRDFSQDLETILEHLPDIVEWTGDVECGISRDDVLVELRNKLQEPEAKFWSVACNKAVRVIFPGVNIKRKGKYKTTYYFGINFVNELGKKSMIYEKHIQQERTASDEMIRLPVINLGHMGSQQTGHMIISSSESTQEENPSFVFSEVKEKHDDSEEHEESHSDTELKEKNVMVFDVQSGEHSVETIQIKKERDDW